MDTTTLGLTLIGLGVGLVAFGNILQRFIRGAIDAKLEKKEEKANEAAKNSANALGKYRDAKREYDDK